ncbi:hypothetical protein GOODEAATRI_015745, partial [Goodea atripinnis]
LTWPCTGALTPLQFPPDLISTRLHSATKRRERGKNNGKGVRRMERATFKEEPGKWAGPWCGFTGNGGIKRALRFNSKGY